MPDAFDELSSFLRRSSIDGFKAGARAVVEAAQRQMRKRPDEKMRCEDVAVFLGEILKWLEGMN